MTALSVLVAALVGIVELASVGVAAGLDGPVAWIAGVGISGLGFVPTAVILVVWIAAHFLTRSRESSSPFRIRLEYSDRK